MSNESFNQTINDLLDYVTTKHKDKRIIIAGDTNIDFLKVNSNNNNNNNNNKPVFILNSAITLSVSTM